MDISFHTGEGCFNYRAAAVILQANRLLVMRDERSPYFYLPGGRVMLHETAEQAVLRELHEELGICAKVNRPLWFVQGFFTEEVSAERYHEICVYFLVDAGGTDLTERGTAFTIIEEGGQQLRFTWMPFEDVHEAYLHPVFLKTKIFSLPDTLECIVQKES